MAIVKINDNNFEAEVLQSEQTVLLDLYADWCGPCRMIAPTIEEVASEHPEIKVGKLNVDEAPSVAIRYGVESIPTLFVFRNGQVANKVVGAVPKATIEAMLA